MVLELTRFTRHPTSMIRKIITILFTVLLVFVIILLVLVIEFHLPQKVVFCVDMVEEGTDTYSISKVICNLTLRRTMFQGHNIAEGTVKINEVPYKIVSRTSLNMHNIAYIKAILCDELAPNTYAISFHFRISNNSDIAEVNFVPDHDDLQIRFFDENGFEKFGYRAKISDIYNIE